MGCCMSAVDRGSIRLQRETKGQRISQIVHAAAVTEVLRCRMERRKVGAGRYE